MAAFLPLPAIEVLSRPGGNALLPSLVALTLGVFVINGVGSVRVLRRFVRLRLGLTAERMTGQELEQSRVPGSKVFHDVPLERCGNVDHVVVAPAGVFAVETKAHRKPVPKIQDGYKVRKDGQRLRFPRYTDFRAIEQAQRQAQVLSRE